jgi:hypothetical protein
MEELLDLPESYTPDIHDERYKGMDIDKRRKVHGKSLEEKGLFNVEKYSCWITGATIKSLSVPVVKRVKTIWYAQPKANISTKALDRD